MKIKIIWTKKKNSRHETHKILVDRSSRSSGGHWPGDSSHSPVNGGRHPVGGTRFTMATRSAAYPATPTGHSLRFPAVIKSPLIGTNTLIVPLIYLLKEIGRIAQSDNYSGLDEYPLATPCSYVFDCRSIEKLRDFQNIKMFPPLRHYPEGFFSPSIPLRTEEK